MGTQSEAGEARTVLWGSGLVWEGRERWGCLLLGPGGVGVAGEGKPVEEDELVRGELLIK